MSEKLSARNAQKLFNAVNGIANSAARAAVPTARTVNAKVVRIDTDGSVFVDIVGGDTGVPISSYSVPVNLDDNVIVVIDGNKAAITGNLTDKSASTSALIATDSKAESAITDAARARLAADSATADAASASRLATTAAAEAAEISETLGQHFWSDDSGAHVTDVPMEDWQTAESQDFPDASDTKQYSNVLLNSAGMLLRSAKKNLVSISRAAVSFFDGDGNASSNVVASFGKNGSQIGYSNGLHMTLSSAFMRVGDKIADTRIYSHMIQIRRYVSYAWQEVFHVGPDNQSTSGTEDPYIVFGNHSDGKQYGAWSVTEGPDSYSQGDCSHAEGSSMVYPNTSYAHAEGFNCSAFGDAAHAEGTNSHAGDGGNGISAWAAHAEGCATSALGDYSHTQNFGTIAEYESQTAIGTYNDNKSANILEVGIGTNPNDRANAVEVAKDGGVKLSSTLNVAGTAILNKSLGVADTATFNSALNVAGYATLDGGFEHTANIVALTYPLAWLDALADGIIETSTASEIVVAESGTTITSAYYKQWGRVASLRLRFTRTSAITVPAHGNITDIDVATVVAGKRPRMQSFGYSDGNGAGQAWYRLSTDGTVTLCACEGNGSSRSIAKGSEFSFYCTYILC